MTCGEHDRQYLDGEWPKKAASPERPSPPEPGMTGESTVKRFTYLLNAMENAAQAKNPAEAEYGAKRKSVLDFVWLLGESLGDAMRRAGEARPGAADPRQLALEEAAQLVEASGGAFYTVAPDYHILVSAKLANLLATKIRALSGGDAEPEYDANSTAIRRPESDWEARLREALRLIIGIAQYGEGKNPDSDSILSIARAAAQGVGGDPEEPGP